jgi:DNA invertase Pin-like site-specific DNA recombinase
MTELVGYVRISTTAQSLAQQHDELARLGVVKVFEDKMSGARADRPGLAALLDYVRPGDTIVVVALDRLGRTLAGIFDTVTKLAERGINVRALREGVDTSTTIGRTLLLPIFGAIAEYERTLIAERSAAARQARRARGERVGRAPKLTPQQRALAVRLRAAGESIRTIHETLGCSRATLYRALREEQAA